MEKKKYLLTIKFEFEAFDDIEARVLAKECISYDFNKMDGDEKFKLQNIFDNKPPRTIEL